jgi:hypothetical protein
MLNTKVLARYCVDTIMLSLDLLLAVGIESRQYFGDDGDASATSLEKLLSEWQFAFRRIVKGELAEGLAPTYLHEPGDVAGVSEARSSAPMAPVKRFKQLRRSFLQVMLICALAAVVVRVSLVLLRAGHCVSGSGLFGSRQRATAAGGSCQAACSSVSTVVRLCN